jgi:hypothetical protein
VTQYPYEAFAEKLKVVTSVKKRASLRCLSKTHAGRHNGSERHLHFLSGQPHPQIRQELNVHPVIAVNVVSTVASSGLAVSTYFVLMVVAEYHISPISVDIPNTTLYLQRLVCLEGWDGTRLFSSD